MYLSEENDKYNDIDVIYREDHLQILLDAGTVCILFQSIFVWILEIYIFRSCSILVRYVSYKLNWYFMVLIQRNWILRILRGAFIQYNNKFCLDNPTELQDFSIKTFFIYWEAGSTRVAHLFARDSLSVYLTWWWICASVVHAKLRDFSTKTLFRNWKPSSTPRSPPLHKGSSISLQGDVGWR